MPNIEEVENQQNVISEHPVIGMFGTCGGSKWRDKFIEKYDKRGIYYFNPNKEDWHPEDAVSEAEHLKNDEIILFPVTNETYGTGSLSEVGFSIMQAIEQNRGAKIVVMIDKDLDGSLDDPIARKESTRSRSIITEHLKKIDAKNLYVVDDLDQMLEVSLGLNYVCEAEKKIRNSMSRSKEVDKKHNDSHDDHDEQ